MEASTDKDHEGPPGEIDVVPQGPRQDPRRGFDWRSLPVIDESRVKIFHPTTVGGHEINPCRQGIGNSKLIVSESIVNVKHEADS